MVILVRQRLAVEMEKTAILLFADCKLGLAGYKRIRFVPEAICRLKQLKNQR